MAIFSHCGMREYRVSLRAPNKRFSIPYAQRKERIIDYLQNMMKIQYYFWYHYGIHIPVINGDQMPLHR